MEILIFIFFNVPDTTRQIHQEICFSFSRRKALMVGVHSCPKDPFFSPLLPPWHVFLQFKQIMTCLCSFWYSDENINHKVHCSSTLDVVTFISLQCRCCNYKEKITSLFQVPPWKKCTSWTFSSCISIRLIRRATRRGYNAPVTFSLSFLVPFFWQLRSISPLCLALLWMCGEVLILS